MRRQAAVYSGRVELAGKYIETGLRARRMRACPRLAGERSPRTVIRRSLLQEQLQTFLTLLNGVSSHRVPQSDSGSVGWAKVFPQDREDES
jgi:hypothetical protein